ncbi:MAG: riboflavin synthase [Elusimicrobiota bacterium]
MFTGIVEQISRIIKLTDRKITVENHYKDLKDGESISINGVCLTVSDFDTKKILFDISPETYQRTNFKYLKPGLYVNMERALKLGDRIGGHILSGHIDELGRIYNIEKQSDSYVFSFKVSDFKYLAEKGSIAINGISLTPFNLRSNIFDVAVIPHTYEKTNLKFLKTGDFVNIEFDIIAKYLNKEEKKITLDFLKENGF